MRTKKTYVPKPLTGKLEKQLSNISKYLQKCQEFNMTEGIEEYKKIATILIGLNDENNKLFGLYCVISAYPYNEYKKIVKKMSDSEYVAKKEPIVLNDYEELYLQKMENILEDCKSLPEFEDGFVYGIYKVDIDAKSLTLVKSGNTNIQTKKSIWDKLKPIFNI